VVFLCASVTERVLLQKPLMWREQSGGVVIVFGHSSSFNLVINHGDPDEQKEEVCC